MNLCQKLQIQQIVVVLFAIIIFMPLNSRAKDIVYWQNVNWPPFQILRGKDAGMGRFDLILKLFQDRLHQYEHHNTEMNWSRYWEEVKAGKHILNCMAIKTPERSQYTVFSNVVTFTLPHRIIMRKSKIEQLGLPRSLTLAEFLMDERFHGVIEQKRSYSNTLDAILIEKEAGGNFARKTLEGGQILNMIVAGRMDYTIEYPFVVDYVMKKVTEPNNEPLGSILIVELPQYITARVAAPKTNWGAKVINDINRVLKDLKTQDIYFDIHKKWYSEKKDIDQITEIYEELFLK